MPDLTMLPYRPCVGMMVVNAVGLVFVGQRIDAPGKAWQMPQGGIDEGEDPEAAAFRELEEEIGTRNVRIIDRTSDWLTYDLPEELIGKVWGGRYRGQKQLWFLMRFLGADSEITIQTSEAEFSAWKWLAIEDLPQTIVPFKKALYTELVDRFRKKVAEG